MGRITFKDINGRRKTIDLPGYEWPDRTQRIINVVGWTFGTILTIGAVIAWIIK